jgi:hypothetical protein
MKETERQRTVHEHRFGNVVRVVPGDDMVYLERDGSPVQSLSTEHPAEGAVILFPDLLDDSIHGPSVQFAIGEDFQGHVVLLLVPLHRLRQSSANNQREMEV